MNKENKKLLVLGVHTDDCEYGIGGASKLLADKGWEVEFFNFCPYKFSPNPESDIIKSKEAAMILGATKIAEKPENKDWWYATPEHSKRIEEEILRFKPDVIFMQWFKDNHIEHVESAKAAINAIFGASVKGARPEEVYAYETGPMQTMPYFQPDIYINITNVKKHIDNALEHFGLPDGEALIKEKEICSRYRGWASRRKSFEYAECLKIIRFPRESNDFLLRQALGDDFSWCSPGKYCYGQKYLFE